jgi:hypothetical protein
MLCYSNRAAIRISHLYSERSAKFDIYILMFLGCFNVFILKIILKEIYYNVFFNIFLNKKQPKNFSILFLYKHLISKSDKIHTQNNKSSSNTRKNYKVQALVRIFSSFKQKRTASKIEKTKKCRCSTKTKPNSLKL